ncbi:Conserved_hypothetical protein [Hexamita inflata]|uniref:Uncharacterized protein n=1 Tax=Hexamita inflata TaxID=28002 RepID=A0AA86Q4J3_9EUKA|nr:Conserved hypothetical protein [Hexamita inflata]
MLSFIASCQAIATSANWLTDVRIWPTQPLYPLTSQYDFMAESPLASVITITGLRLFSNFRGNCSYSALDGFKTSSLKNAVFIFNVLLEVPQSCTSVEVSFMNAAQGSLDNITVTGSVSFTSAYLTSIRASQFVGHAFENSSINSFFTNLSFYLNGAQLVNSSSVSISPSNFDGKTIGTELIQNEIVLGKKIVSTCEGSLEFTYQNGDQTMIKEWYPVRLELFQWKMKRAKYYFVDFDASGSITTDFTLSVQRAYYFPGTVNIAVYLENGTELECNKFYDPVTKTCTQNCSEGKQFEQFCQAACPTNYLPADDSNICYVQCPATLGYYKNGAVCTKCLSNKKVTNLAVSINECYVTCPSSSNTNVNLGCFPKVMPSNSYSLGNDCLSVCAPGFYMDSSCKSSCSEGQLALINLRLCEECTVYHGGLLWFRKTATCQASCEYLNSTSNYCEELGTQYCENFYVDTNGQNICVHQCPSNYPFLQPELQRCYDACPTIFLIDMPHMQCVNSCPSTFYYFTNSTRFCLDVCEPTNFTAIESDKHDSNLRCESSCSLFDSKPFSNAHTCVNDCRSTPNKFIALNGFECTDNCSFYHYDNTTLDLFCTSDCDQKFQGVDLTYDPVILRCEASCSMFSTIKFIQSNTCLDICDNLTPYYLDDNKCVAQCYDQASLKFLNEGSNACVSTCAFDSYYRVNADQFLFCTPAACAASNFTGVESYHATYSRCESSCALFQTLNFIDGQSCLLVCPTERKYFDDVKNCSASCPSAIPYAEADNHCVSLCTSQNYSVRADVQPKICTGVCPIFFVVNASNSDSKQCVSECFSQTTHKFIDTITSECVAVCPAPFYNRDSSTQFLTCLPDCSSNQHGLDVTYDATMERCEAACSDFSTTKFTKDDLCQDQCDGAKPYFITGNICVAQCYDQASLKFLNEGSNACVSTCASGSYYRNNADQFLFCTPAACAASNFTGVESYHATYSRCESSCALFQTLNFIDGQSCLLVCPTERKYFDDVKNCSASCPSAIPYAEADNHCVSLCASQNYSVRADIQPKICTGVCPIFFVVNASNSDSKQCVSECFSQTTHKFIDTITSECVAVCPAPFYNRDSSTQFLTCLPDCSSNQHGLDVTYDATMERCEAACSMFSTTKFTKDDLCQDQCDGAKPYFITGNICVAQCYDQASLKFLNEGSNACVSTCAFDSYYRNNADQFLFCTPAACAASNFTGVDSYHATYSRCESSCALFQTLNFIDGQSCLLVCPTERKYFDDVKNCSASCPSAIPYAEADNHCVSLCASQNYSVRADVQPKICTGACPVYFVVNASNSDSKQCVSECFSQTTHKFIDTITSECVAVCPAPFYNRDSSTQFLTCLPDCSSNQHGLDVTYDATMERCEVSCKLFSTVKYAMDQVCQDKCENPKPYSADYICVAHCFERASLKYLSEDGLSCVANCSIFRPVSLELQCQSSCLSPDINATYNDLFYCFKDCGNQSFYSAENTCVDSCPDSLVSFAKLCVISCPTGYAVASITNNTCKANSANKSGQMTYIVIGVALLALIVVAGMTLYLIKRKNSKRTPKKNASKIGKDTMYYARRLEVKQKQRQKLIRVNDDNSELKSKVKTVQYSGKEDESISSYSSTSVSNYSNDGESKTRVIQQAQRLSPKQKGSPRQAQFVTKEYLKDAPKPTQKVAIKRTVAAQKKGSVMKGIQNKYDSTVI